MKYVGNSLTREEKNTLVELINKMYERKDDRLLEAVEQIIETRRSLISKGK